MALNIESCSLEEASFSISGDRNLVGELRDRLQEWLRLQPHLPQDIPKGILENFILGTKMSLEEAKRKLDTFYTIRRFVPEILANRDPRGPGLTELHKVMRIVCLPKLTPEKYRVYVMSAFGGTYSNLDPFDCFKYFSMMEEILMTESRSLSNLYIFDLSSATLGLLAKFTPSVIKKSEVTITEAYAERIQGFHFVNASQLTETIITLAKQVVKPKLAARMHTHAKGDMESLYKHIPKSILPSDYGGDGPSIDFQDNLWREKMDEKKDWFLKQDNIVVDERLRPAGPTFDGDDLFGFSGSFRKLQVD